MRGCCCFSRKPPSCGLRLFGPRRGRPQNWLRLAEILRKVKTCQKCQEVSNSVNLWRAAGLVPGAFLRVDPFYKTALIPRLALFGRNLIQGGFDTSTVFLECRKRRIQLNRNSIIRMSMSGGRGTRTGETLPASSLWTLSIPADEGAEGRSARTWLDSILSTPASFFFDEGVHPSATAQALPKVARMPINIRFWR